MQPTMLVAATTANVLDKTEKMLVSLAAIPDRFELVVLAASCRCLLAALRHWHLCSAFAVWPRNLTGFQRWATSGGPLVADAEDDRAPATSSAPAGPQAFYCCAACAAGH